MQLYQLLFLAIIQGLATRCDTFTIHSTSNPSFPVKSVRKGKKYDQLFKITSTTDMRGQSYRGHRFNLNVGEATFDHHPSRKPMTSFVRKAVNSFKSFKAITRVTKRFLVNFMAVVLFTLGSVSKVAPSNARSSAVATSMVMSASSARSVSTSSATDAIIRKYVEKHMFDDEQYDPFESAYREAYEDFKSDKNAIKDILSEAGISVATSADEAEAGKALESKAYNFFGAYKKFLMNRFGLSGGYASLAVFATTLLGIFAIPGYFIVLVAGNFRGELNKTEGKTFDEQRDFTAFESRKSFEGPDDKKGDDSDDSDDKGDEDPKDDDGSDDKE